MYFFSCSSETRCKYFFGIIDVLTKLMSTFDIPDLISSNSILTIAAISSCFKKLKSSGVLAF